MPPRPTWRGHLSVSLVNFGVRLYNATNAASRISFHYLHRDCGQRLKQQLMCPVHGEVARSDMVKGYEYEKDTYIVVEPEEIKRLEAATSKTITIDQFIEADELHSIYLERPYYVGPDGDVAQQGFRLIHEAMQRSNKIGIGRFVIHGNENIVALETEGPGFRLTTLRSAAEIRQADEVFDDIEESKVDAKQLKLAEDLLKTITAPLDTSKFRDSFQEALRELVEAKIEGQEPVFAEEPAPSTTFNFMEALQASLKQAGRGGGAGASRGAAIKTKKKTAKKPAARSVKPAAAKRRKRA